jgi:hypothetical protein
MYGNIQPSDFPSIHSSKVLDSSAGASTKRPFSWTKEDDLLLQEHTSFIKADGTRSKGYNGHMLESLAAQQMRPLFTDLSTSVEAIFEDVQVLDVTSATLEPQVIETTVLIKALPRLDPNDKRSVVTELVPVLTEEMKGMPEYKAKLLYKHWPAFKAYLTRKDSPEKIELSISHFTMLNPSEKEVLRGLGCETIRDFVELDESGIKLTKTLLAKKETARAFLAGIENVKKVQEEAVKTKSKK